MQSPFTCLDLKDKTNWGRMKDAHNVASAWATSKGGLISEGMLISVRFSIR